MAAQNLNHPGTGSGDLAISMIPTNHQHHTSIPIAPPPVPQPLNQPNRDLLRGSRENYVKIGVPLYEATMKGDWKAAKHILDCRPDLIRFALTRNWETVLHVTASAERNKAMEEFMKNLVEMMASEDLEIRDIYDNTAFGLAAVTGNVEAARIMVEKNNKLMEIPCTGGMMPLTIAAHFAKDDMVKYLYDKSKKMHGDFWSLANRGKVLKKCVKGNILDVAIQIASDHPELMVKKKIVTKVLFALARNASAFKVFKPSLVCRIINSLLHVKVEDNTKALQLLRIIWKNIAIMPQSKIDYILNGSSIDEESREVRDYPSRVLFLASKMGNTPFVVELIRLYPDLIWAKDDKGKTIFHLAIKYRQTDIYNLLYEIGGRKEVITTVEDINNNNILHMAAKNVTHKQFLDKSGGVAFQMQRELLWFKNVEMMIPPDYRRKKNKDGETSENLFTKTHADLLTESKVWMKDTASQCMVVSTLITTIVFTAAFTLPGGYNQNTGIPFFRKEPSLIIFVLSDAVSLISSSTSVLMFLSIITSSYGELDFMASLPNKLLYGLATLFLSIAAMMVAFSASFFVLYNKELDWMPITVTCLAGIPVILYIMLQYSLFRNVFNSAYQSKYIFRPIKHIIY